MLIEIENVMRDKHEAKEALIEIHNRYGLSSAGYRIRKATSIERDPTLSKYIFKKEKC